MSDGEPNDSLLPDDPGLTHDADVRNPDPQDQGNGNPLLPSGAWVGFYLYARSDIRHRMNLKLSFAKAGLHGSGVDGIGDFLVSGEVDTETGVVSWSKGYLDAERIDTDSCIRYHGHADANGIWGSWRSRKDGECGTFRIWPDAQASDRIARDDGDAEVRLVERPLLRLAVGYSTHAPFGEAV